MSGTSLTGQTELIELFELSKTYPDGTRALEPLSLAAGPGVLGLLGPNGAGKTTLLEMVVLALEPSTGRRSYFGIDDRPAHRHRLRPLIGYLPQEMPVLPRLTGLQVLLFCGRVRQVPLGGRALRTRCRLLLEAVELDEAANRPAREYSGGMLRRLGLAQALVHAPRLLVVDEPTAGLDPEERIRFRTVITEIAERIPVLLSTHIVEDIEATCPRVVILSHGRLAFDGSPSELIQRAPDRDPPPSAPSLERAYGAFLAELEPGPDGAAEAIRPHDGAS